MTIYYLLLINQTRGLSKAIGLKQARLIQSLGIRQFKLGIYFTYVSSTKALSYTILQILCASSKAGCCVIEPHFLLNCENLIKPTCLI